ncbi:DUF1109 family protein [Siculibacillus lacustris]|uniref:DUF1109 family protein n=1 Tax=Siculibacillus lacustris TaxID=1549641 RepID=A0A4Q9VG69_9HYPH|nr:DUF1109 domain-containing protein [Siculibacillus lacustris]TBW33427.1 DUF1109 family protein [Siculibacillus lacustris]
MKTDDLIRLLAADTQVREPLGPAIAVALGVGLAVCAVLLVFQVHLRHDLLTAILQPRVAFKIGVTAAVAVLAIVLLDRIGRPGVPVVGAGRLLLLPLAAVLIAVALELAMTPAASWGERLVGRNPGWCLVYIPVFAAVPLAAILTAMRRAAPESPTRAGAVAGLAAAGMAAAFYAWHCPDDSPLFLATWYVIASAAVTGVGALLGRRLLVW